MLLSSCGKNRSGEMTGAGVTDSHIIVGDLDWQDLGETSSQSVYYQKGLPVADVDLPLIGSRCTGFLINQDTLLTNHHCIPTAADARGVTATFLRQQGKTSAEYRKYDCSTFIANNATLDFALLKCQGLPGQVFGAVELSSELEAINSDVYVIQQNCDYYSNSDCQWDKKIAKGKIIKVAQEYTHNADTLGGSSGSPVFSERTHKVVGLHHAGLGNNGRGRGIENYAVPFSKIVPALQALGIQLGVGTQVPSTPVTSFEPNETQGAAKSVDGLKQEWIAEEISSKTDRDYYRFTLAKTTHVGLSLSLEHAKGDLDLRLYTKEGKLVKSSQSTSNVEKIEHDLPAGEYAFQVYGYQGATGKYQFKLEKRVSESVEE